MGEVAELVKRMLDEQEGRRRRSEQLGAHGERGLGGTSSGTGGGGGPARRLRRKVGEEAFGTLKAESRRFQRGETDAGGLYQRAQVILAGDRDKIAAWMQLASLLRDEPKRRALAEVHVAATGRSPGLSK